MRESCTICGMIANVDPAGHAERYGHDPIVYRDGVEMPFDWKTYTFRVSGSAGVVERPESRGGE